MGGYIPTSPEIRREMLSKIGAESIDSLFADIPAEIKLNRPLNIPAGLAEASVRRKMETLAQKNRVYKTVFRGAGAYRHYIPSIVKNVVSKEEFLTAYTPYQPEISQGILQSIFEYQTYVCELTGMDVSNASVYDGASAAAEAVSMCTEPARRRALISAAVNPNVVRTVKTYCTGLGIELEIIPANDGLTDAAALKHMLGADVCCVYIQQPNFYGCIENAQELGELAHGFGSKYIMGFNPIATAILKTPGECGADIAAGEGQPLGIPLSWGGPYLGILACKAAMMRKLPGRIVGETTDSRGNRAFVLTLQAREQHIRREKASSNICSNEALCALTASAYLSAMGPKGLREVAHQCMAKAHYFAARLSEIKGFNLKFKATFFHEFVTECPIDAEIITDALARHGILGGLPLSGGLENRILWCATEQNTKQEIDRVVEIISAAAEGAE
jgi:glycine dehydrogenase subunit 1